MPLERMLPTRVCCIGGLLLACAAQAVPARAAEETDGRDLVAIGIVEHGRAIVLATSGLPNRGRIWRFRSLDTSDLPQPIQHVVLSAGGTKLFVQPGRSRGVVLDLTRQHRHNTPLQYVAPADLAPGGGTRAHSHRLVRQRFVSIHDGEAYIIDDVGTIQTEFPAQSAVAAAISDDGVALYVRPDGVAVICGERASNPRDCRDLPDRLNVQGTAVNARSTARNNGLSVPRFLVLAEADDRTDLIDPEHRAAPSRMQRTEAALQACLMVNGMSMSAAKIASYANTLVRESADTWAAAGHPVTNWRFFRVVAEEDLYAPVLELAALESVFPAPFEAFDGMTKGDGIKGTQPRVVERLYDKYLRLARSAREAQCTMYYRTHSTHGSWLIEYWLYYPFDVGGFVSHPHDPEHIFVEVDKLGGAPRRIIGAGHGYVAGNNMYTADRAGARALGLPLFAIVELGKHASAPDIDRDGLFTPGIDENEYRERSKIWGVRDVIGTINNQILAFDTAMSTARRPEHWLALASANTRFAGELPPAARAICRLQPMPPTNTRARRPLCRVSDWFILPPCHELTADCARRHVTEHPDFIDVRTILKEWAFPQSFVRATYGIGPRRGLHSIGVGYATDLDRVPLVGRFLPLPGRLGVDGFYWRQDRYTLDTDSCIADCSHSAGGGWAIRYEQFVANLFGIFSAVRVYSPPLKDTWIAFGPFVEVPLGRRSNLTVEGGLAFRPSDSPRFELRVSGGVWKPKTNHVGMRAGPDYKH